MRFDKIFHHIAGVNLLFIIDIKMFFFFLSECLKEGSPKRGIFPNISDINFGEVEISLFFRIDSNLKRLCGEFERLDMACSL